jgi:hypothetical protein
MTKLLLKKKLNIHQGAFLYFYNVFLIINFNEEQFNLLININIIKK